MSNLMKWNAIITFNINFRLDKTFWIKIWKKTKYFTVWIHLWDKKMSLPLKIEIVDQSVTKTLKFEDSTLISQACIIIREKINQTNLKKGEHHM